MRQNDLYYEDMLTFHAISFEARSSMYFMNVSPGKRAKAVKHCLSMENPAEFIAVVTAPHFNAIAFRKDDDITDAVSIDHCKAAISLRRDELLQRCRDELSQVFPILDNLSAEMSQPGYVQLSAEPDIIGRALSLHAAINWLQWANMMYDPLTKLVFAHSTEWDMLSSEIAVHPLVANCDAVKLFEGKQAKFDTSATRDLFSFFEDVLVVIDSNEGPRRTVLSLLVKPEFPKPSLFGETMVLSQ